MILHPRTRAPKSPGLAEAEADFTAEGAPPPGKVATTTPVVPPAVTPLVSRDPVRARRKTRKGPAPVGRHRW
jgi:hypothetical protein